MLNGIFYAFGTKSWKPGMYFPLTVYLHSDSKSSPEDSLCVKTP